MPLITTRANASARGFGFEISAAILPDTGVMFPLQAVAVGAAGASSVSFTSIPATYNHLQIRSISRNNRSNDIEQTIRLNFGTSNSADESASYSYHRLIGDGSGTPTALGGGGTNYIWAYAASSSDGAGSGIFGSLIIDILDYANTNKLKTVRFLSGYDVNGAGRMNLGSGYWNNGAGNGSGVLSYIRISLEGGHSFKQHSHFALYGIKGYEA